MTEKKRAFWVATDKDDPRWTGATRSGAVAHRWKYEGYDVCYCEETEPPPHIVKGPEAASILARGGRGRPMNDIEVSIDLYVNKRGRVLDENNSYVRVDVRWFLPDAKWIITKMPEENDDK